jgi:uncharacterized protein YxeA
MKNIVDMCKNVLTLVIGFLILSIMVQAKSRGPLLEINFNKDKVGVASDSAYEFQVKATAFDFTGNQEVVELDDFSSKKKERVLLFVDPGKSSSYRYMVDLRFSDAYR